jgi:hypothetical protein
MPFQLARPAAARPVWGRGASTVRGQLREKFKRSYHTRREGAAVFGSNVATRTGAAKPSDFSKVIVDTTVQEKAIAFPTDAKLDASRARMSRAARQETRHGLAPILCACRQARIAHQRYAHAKQFKRANKALRQDQDLSWPRRARHRPQDQGQRGMARCLPPTF